VARQQRQAMSRAEGATLEAWTRRQSELVQRVAALEEQRRKIALALGSSAAAPVAQVAAGLPEPARGRIMRLAARLREVLMLLQEQNRTLRAAAGALVAHMNGLMQQVSRRVSEAGTYGREGNIRTGPTACALDMRH
jgi:flagellar biosynthesis/type III secretory pathway chaperone